MEDGCVDSIFTRRFVTIPKYFDPNLVFFGSGDAPLQLCQRLMDTVVNSPSLLTVRPSISLLSMIPEIVEELPATMKGLQVVAFGKKYNWKQDDVEGVFYVTDYDSIRLDGLKKHKDIAVEEFLESRNIPRGRLFGVIFQQKEPLWLSPIRSAEVFNFKKRLADVLNVKSGNIFWVHNQEDIANLLSVTMSQIYRWREDKESEVGYFNYIINYANICMNTCCVSLPLFPLREKSVFLTKLDHFKHICAIFCCQYNTYNIREAAFLEAKEIFF